MERYMVKPGAKLDLGAIDPHEKTLYRGEKDEIGDRFLKLQQELQLLQKKLYAENKRRILVVIQAMDTGGKDGCIKHVFSHIDPQGIHVAPFKKPTADELSRDFLSRVHAQVPSNGEIVIFNRSHYEDIIAVRVKKLYPDEVWQRRQRHVLEFERMLAEEGTTIIKFFLHISKVEQKARLLARLENPEKQWKVNPDDLVDRARWQSFMTAYEDVIAATSTPAAPWYVIPADRKWYRNLCVASIMADTMEKLDMKFPPINWDPASLKIED